MTIILAPDETEDYSSEYFNYPHKSKVLSGINYGHNNKFTGELNPRKYVNELEEMKIKLNNRNDLKEG